ncbi:MAG TPA: hypothetical protein VGB97_03260 [Candidatus Paceibacterota bacterium]|jgi:hypothetical protein
MVKKKSDNGSSSTSGAGEGAPNAARSIPGIHNLPGEELWKIRADARAKSPIKRSRPRNC